MPGDNRPPLANLRERRFWSWTRLASGFAAHQAAVAAFCLSGLAKRHLAEHSFCFQGLSLRHATVDALCFSRLFATHLFILAFALSGFAARQAACARLRQDLHEEHNPSRLLIFLLNSVVGLANLHFEQLFISSASTHRHVPKIRTRSATSKSPVFSTLLSPSGYSFKTCPPSRRRTDFIPDASGSPFAHRLGSAPVAYVLRQPYGGPC